MFNDELLFEKELINLLKTKGWEDEVIKYPSEKDLIDNWAEILFNNNKEIDKLNNCPLTDGEMRQIIEQIKNLKTPFALNSFINGKTVTIKRDNPNDKEHFGKSISLHIYDRKEIAGGKSRYQLVEQPRFEVSSSIYPERRGDLMLLINGMPLFHIELKRTGVPISQAINQIKKYYHEGVFTGLFSLVQIFVVMTPEKTLYFANPGSEDKFNPSYYFSWSDFHNKIYNDWQDIGKTLLSIPMAHQLIGFYTVADDTDNTLKVMRPYQYYAVNAISDKVAKVNWNDNNLLGGYIWHTTGSGKTLSSFKAAELIADSNYADKVVFLMDRIDLGDQSLREYRNFAGKTTSVQETENTKDLIGKLTSNSINDILIVTSIQKMSNVNNEIGEINTHDLNTIQSKRLVFIVDECHRSTFGDMLAIIKKTFPNAIFFGFTGTPIKKEHKKKDNIQSDIFGDELHEYSIAYGIRDKNVLGFDPYRIETFKRNDLRLQIIFNKCKTDDLDVIHGNPEMEEIYNHYMNEATMIEIENEVPMSQYRTPQHTNIVVNDIIMNWDQYSRNGMFHAIFATSSILEAIHYYRLFKAKLKDNEIKVTALFDPSVDNEDDSIEKEEGLKEIIEDYNKHYNKAYTIPTHREMKKDISRRLAHKKPYLNIAQKPEEQINILIVVDQMLTGFDSKWVNTLYLDKMLEYENIIQAFSRTNRLFGPQKPYGIIRYYRKPYTMEEEVKTAVDLYSGNADFDLFVNKLEKNLENINLKYKEIKNLFELNGIYNFERLTDSIEDNKKFAKLFNELTSYIEAAEIQGFYWDKNSYIFEETGHTVLVELDKITYDKLLQRYKELFITPPSGGSSLPFDIDSHITDIDTGKIDDDYMNNKFIKYLESLKRGENTEEKNKLLDELHQTFALLSQEEQKYANIILHDAESDKLQISPNKTLRDYITDYQFNALNDQIRRVATIFNVDENKLRNLINLKLDENNINEYGRFDELLSPIDYDKAKRFFEEKDKEELSQKDVKQKTKKLLRNFICNGGFEV